MTTGQLIARKLLDDEQWQREGLVNWVALAQWIDSAIEEARAEMAHENLIEHDRALASAIEAAREEERAACLEVVMAWFHPTTQGLMPDQDMISKVAAKIARKIRARSQLPPIVD